jgi:hypothetical protein
MKFSDIQLADKTLWQQIQEEWSKGNVDSAQAIMSNTQLDKKVLTAKSLNDLTDKIVEVEQLNDPTYAKDKIKVERQVPTDLTTGQVYFEWTNSPPYTWAEVDARNYTFADVDALGINWAYADRGGW